MDDLTFDRLARLVSTGASRREVVRSAGASALGALGLSTMLAAPSARAKKGKKKRRCKKDVDASCNPPGKKCCRGLACEEGKCCKKLGTKCEDGSECCGAGICDQVEGGNSQTLCCHLSGEPCSKTSDCCDTLACSGGQCVS